MSDISAKAGIQFRGLDPRLRGNDEPEIQKLTKHEKGILAFDKSMYTKCVRCITANPVDPNFNQSAETPHEGCLQRIRYEPVGVSECRAMLSEHRIVWGM